MGRSRGDDGVPGFFTRNLRFSLSTRTLAYPVIFHPSGLKFIRKEPTFSVRSLRVLPEFYPSLLFLPEFYHFAFVLQIQCHLKGEGMKCRTQMQWRLCGMGDGGVMYSVTSWGRIQLFLRIERGSSGTFNLQGLRGKFNRLNSPKNHILRKNFILK